MGALIIIGLSIVYIFVGVLSLIPLSLVLYGNILSCLKDDDEINIFLTVFFWPMTLFFIVIVGPAKLICRGICALLQRRG